MTKIVQYWLVTSILDTIVSESQCGFRSNYSIINMIFATRQLQEKCIEHNISLYTVFTDLTKAFDSISHDSLWKILVKQGIPDKYIIVLMQLHDGTHGDV